MSGIITLKLSGTYRGAVNQISPRTQQLIDACPTDGNGLHFHMCKVANYLRHDGDEDWGIEVLFNMAVSNGYSERKARYHAEQLRKKWHETTTGYQRRQPKIEPNLDLICRTVNESDLKADSLSTLSPVKLNPNDESVADNVVDLLFPNGDIVCVGGDAIDACCAPHKEIQGSLSKAQFLVPNPMRERGEYHYGKEWKPGKTSPRCDANVLYRRWLVVEFDISRYGRDGKTPTFWKPLIDEWEMEGISAQDAQIRLIQRVTGYEFPLAMIVFSGSKSLHSWFPVTGAREIDINNFIDRALNLGADKAAKVPSQYFRMPDGWNYKTQSRQPVQYLDLQVITNKGKK
jgi:hypothetical protein